MDISLLAPVTEAKKSMSCVYRKSIANVREKESAFTKDTLDIN
jgi:hypothetical protein